MTTDTDKIENCPFCGNHAEFRHGAIHGESWGELRRVLWCSSSHCRAQMSLPYDYTNANAVLIRSWNCRSLSAELTELRQAVVIDAAHHIETEAEKKAKNYLERFDADEKYIYVEIIRALLLE